MAAVTPGVKGDTGWIPNGKIWPADAAASPDPITNRRPISTAGLRHERFYFSDIDDGELWTTPPAGAVAIALQILSDQTVVQVATLNAARQVLYSADAAAVNTTGYLHVWSRGGKSYGTGTNVPPVSKGTAGYVTPRKSLLIADQDNGATSPLTTGRFVPTGLGALRHHVKSFSGVNANDTWTPSARIVPMIVDYAWQARTPDDAAQLTLNGTAFTFFGDDSVDGWLHFWTR